MTEDSQDLRLGSPTVSKGDLYIKYSVIVLLVLNTLLFIFLSYKLWRFYSRTPSTNFEKKNRKYRAFIFGFILLALVIRGLFEIHEILVLSQIIQEDTISSFGVLIDAFPSLLFVSIACVFSYFWHQTYCSFEDYRYDKDRKSFKFKLFLIGFNAILYSIFGGLIYVWFMHKWPHTFLTLHCVFMASLIFSTILLKVNGSNLYKKALALVSYTGRNVRSSRGFKMIYMILLLCCVLRCAKEGISIYFSAASKDDVLKQLANSNDGALLPALIAYMTSFYVLGEYGLFFSLILLLDFYADKAKVTCSTVGGERDSTIAFLNERQNFSPFTINGLENKGIESDASIILE